MGFIADRMPPESVLTERARPQWDRANIGLVLLLTGSGTLQGFRAMCMNAGDYAFDAAW